VPAVYNRPDVHLRSLMGSILFEYLLYDTVFVLYECTIYVSYGRYIQTEQGDRAEPPVFFTVCSALLVPVQ